MPAHRPVLVHRQDHLTDVGAEVRSLEDQTFLAGCGPHLLVGHGGVDPINPDLDELPFGHIGLAHRIDEGVGGVLDPWRPCSAGDTRIGGGVARDSRRSDAVARCNLNGPCSPIESRHVLSLLSARQRQTQVRVAVEHVGQRCR